MKKVDQYRAFDIKISVKGKYFPRSNNNFRYNARINLGGYETLEKAKEAIDRFYKIANKKN